MSSKNVDVFGGAVQKEENVYIVEIILGRVMSPSRFLNLALSRRTRPLFQGRPRASLLGYLEQGVLGSK